MCARSLLQDTVERWDRIGTPAGAIDPMRYLGLNKRLLALAPAIFAQDQTSVFAASNRVLVPALSDPSKAFALAGFGFTFRLMEMKE